MVCPRRLALPALALLVVLSSAVPVCGFAAKSTSLVEMRRRSLMKTAANKASPNRPNRRKRIREQPANTHHPLSKSFLLDALEEALLRQRTAIDALDREVERKRIAMEEMDATEWPSQSQGMGDEREEALEPVVGTETSSRDSFGRMEARRDELHDASLRLQQLRSTMQQTKGQMSPEKLEQTKEVIAQLGHSSIFRQPPSSWKIAKAREQEFGRPRGFDGEVYHSPLGVPILVGRMNAHKDEIMRNAAQGSDLWFQVEDYNGSRVLLRTSMMRGTEGSKQCRQMAADLAAKFSVWGEEHESIPVMYTHSRKVAKRGSRIGNMKKSKSLGRMMGYPQNVEDAKYKEYPKHSWISPT